MGIPINPSGNLTATGGIAIKNVGHAQAANTFKAVAEMWYDENAAHKSESWRIGTRGRLERYAYPQLGGTPVSDIGPADVLALIKDIKYAKTAEYVRQIVARVFAYAVLNLKARTNPARELRGAVIVPQATHHKPIPAKDLPEFIDKLDGYAGRVQTKLAAKLLILTMTRKLELIHASWDEIDLENALWTIPPARMKRRFGHVVPLSSQAVAAFEELKPLSYGSRFVFPNFADPRKTMSSSTLNMMFDRLKFAVSPHSLRSTASTILNESGLFRPDVIERQLSHIERNRIRAAYNAAEYLDERRHMMSWWADFVDRPANVVSLRKRA